MKTVRFIMLVGVSDLRAKKNNHPAYLNPAEEQRKCSKATINGSVTRYPYLELDVYPLHDLGNRSCSDSTYNGRPERNSGVWHNQVEHGEEKPDGDIGQQVQQEDNGMTENSQKRDFMQNHGHLARHKDRRTTRNNKKERTKNHHRDIVAKLSY